MESIVLFGVFFILLILGVPIGYAIGISTLINIVGFTSMPTMMIAQNSVACIRSLNYSNVYSRVFTRNINGCSTHDCLLYCFKKKWI